jgi:hypothetical protein
MLNPVIQIGFFTDEPQRVIDAGFQCQPLEAVLDSPRLCGGVRGIITRNLPIAPAVLDSLHRTYLSETEFRLWILDCAEKPL